MAVFTRTNGDLRGVVSVDVGIATATANATTISTGIGKKPQFFGITSNITTTNYNWVNQLGTGYGGEAVMKVIGTKATVLAYQPDAALLSVMIEDSSWNATDLQANLQALGTSVGTDTLNYSGLTVTDLGFKLAVS